MTTTEREAAAATGERIAYRSCPLCEACCGLEITVRDERVVRIRGDRDDVASHGYLCPKGSVLGHLHDDPDRLRRPLVRRAGELVEVGWDEAWSEVAARLGEFFATHGRAALATYHGNPVAHSLGAMLMGRPLSMSLGHRTRFTASTIDQMPRQVAAAMVFGSPAAVPVPDLDRTDHLLVLGGNPMVSNGSLCTAPDFPGRLRRLRERGGRLVVIDPKRTRTAEVADRWVPIRPGTDALALAAMVTHLARTGRADPGERLSSLVEGTEEVLAVLREFTPESVERACGIAASELIAVAEEFAAAPRAAVYGRLGTTTTAFGTTASWLVDVLNVITGNLDRVGGSMFPAPLVGGVADNGDGRGPGYRAAQRTTRHGAPVVLGEAPAASLAEEILDPGEGQVRGLITVAGNPVLSAPNGGRLPEALDSLALMISVDVYCNETTRFADVILPPPSVLEKSHFDLALLPFSVRNTANYSPPVLRREPGQPDEWEIIAKLAAIAGGAPPDVDPATVTELAVEGMLRAAAGDDASPVAGRDVDELRAALVAEAGPERILEIMVRLGPYGDGFAARDGIDWPALRDAPHGIDLGPLQPRLPGVLRTTSGKVELNAAPLIADVSRLAAMLGATAGPPAAPDGPGLVLIGRRHLRSNNSWMHNLPVLTRGAPRCTLQMHPDDLAARGLRDGEPARITSRVGELLVHVEATEAMMPGVVSLPHGWGHDAPGSTLRQARERPGVNTNVLVDHEVLDPLSATVALNGVPVEVGALPSTWDNARPVENPGEERAHSSPG